MYTLSNLIQDGIALLGSSAYFRGVATGGSATTLADTTLTEKSEEDLKNGTLIVTYDAGGAGASPEGKIGIVSAYVDSTFTMTFPTVTDAIVAGDYYMHISPQFPLPELKKIVGLALQRAGTFIRWDTSITTAGDQTEYTLPVGLKLHPQNLDIRVQTHLNDTDYNGWTAVTNYSLIPSAGGAVGTLVLPQFDAGYSVGIGYETVHPAVNIYNDPIDEAIHPVLAQLLFATELFAWVGIGDDNRDQANKVLSDLAEAKKLYKLPRLPRRIHYLTWGR